MTNQKFYPSNPTILPLITTITTNSTQTANSIASMTNHLIQVLTSNNTGITSTINPDKWFRPCNNPNEVHHVDNLTTSQLRKYISQYERKLAKDFKIGFDKKFKSHKMRYFNYLYNNFPDYRILIKEILIRKSVPKNFGCGTSKR